MMMITELVDRKQANDLRLYFFITILLQDLYSFSVSFIHHLNYQLLGTSSTQTRDKIRELSNPHIFC